MKTHFIPAYLINTSDEHSNEYIGPSDNRIPKVSSFTGSNGLLLVTSESDSYLWTDTRYHIQAANQLKLHKSIKLVKDIDEFYKIVNNNNVVGLNLKHWSNVSFTNLKLKCTNTSFEHYSVDDVYGLEARKFKNVFSLEDTKMKAIFNDRDIEMVKEYYKWFIPENSNLDFNGNVSGSTRMDKIGKLRKVIKYQEVMVITKLDEIAYLLNLRGSDIPFNPVFYSFLLVSNYEIVLFTNAKIDIDGIEIRDYYTFYDDCGQIKDRNVIISHDCNQYLYDILSSQNKTQKDNTIGNMKSVKNANEIFGFIMAHVYDGISLCALFEYVQKTLKNSSLTELAISKKLFEIKSKVNGFFSESFETISASGENAAIIHHQGSEKLVDNNALYLIDSGSQYYFGTTDVTRTVAFNNATDIQKSDYTYVLKGQIDAITAVFNKEYSSTLLDILTRMPIWKNTSVDDFGHSTGHGVGHFLNVHEGPPSISANGTKLEENMVFSIEPGLYKEGEYGIRIEDLVVVRSHSKSKFKLHNLTVVPLQMKMINLDLMEKEHVDYIKEYNRRVRGILSKYMNKGDEGYDFLMENTTIE